MSTINIVTSGDHKADSVELASAKDVQENINLGLCPNGCGPMEDIYADISKCSVCGFSNFKIKVNVKG